MATNRKFMLPADAKEVDLTKRSTKPSPDPTKPYIDLGPLGWKLVVSDDPEDREPLPKPAA